MTCLLLAALLQLAPADFFIDLEKRYPPTSEQHYVVHLATADGLDSELVVRQGAVSLTSLAPLHELIGVRVLSHSPDGAFEVWVMTFGHSNNHPDEFDSIEQLEKFHIMGFEQREVLTGDLYVDIKLLQQ